MPISGQKPTPTSGRTMAPTPPSAAPMINRGASTPPDVPEPSAMAQISALTMTSPTMISPASRPLSRSRSVS